MDKDFDTLKGKDITDARNELGYWWRLDKQFVNCGLGYYIFYRIGHTPINRVELFTENNIVTNVKTALVFSM